MPRRLTPGLWSFLVPTYVVLIWIVASASSRERGGLTFAAALVAVGIGILYFRAGRRDVLYRLYAVTLMAASVALALELALWTHPGVLDGALANFAYGGYHWFRGGIYDRDLHRGAVMVAGFRRRMYWNGHSWMHETNADGYRGARLEQADAVFLGDSMIYGHGVEQDDTVAARFQALTGRPTANLGQQGTGAIQQLMAFQATGRRLHPRLVFAASHPTDIADALEVYDIDELRHFDREGLVEGQWPIVREKYRPRPSWDLFDLWARRLAFPLRVNGLAGAAVRTALLPRGEAPSPDPFAAAAALANEPFAAATAQATENERLGWSAHLRALIELRRECEAAHAQLIVLDLGIPHAFSTAVETAVKAAGITYSPAGRIAFARAAEGAPVYLPRDGHWTPTGTEIVARELGRETGGSGR
jgi:hypothetical protein